MKTILLPTDFSASSTTAVHYAAALTAKIRGKLILVHVLTPEYSGAPEGAVVTLPPDPRLELYYQDKLLKLFKQIRLDYGFLFDLETINVQGNLPEELNKVNRDKRIDLVVMGTKGAHNILEKFTGTNTAGFIKEAECPVLVIPENAKFNGIQSIAYASAFETDETLYLEQLLQLTQPFSPVINIINTKTDVEENQVTDLQILQDIQNQFPDNQFCISQMEDDDVVTGIHQFIKDNPVDVLAVSIPEKSFLEDLFHWSISRQLAFASQVPLLTLPAKPFQQPGALKFEKPASRI